jgi:hypothetical protein
MTRKTHRASTATRALLVNGPKDQPPQSRPLTISVSQACQLSGLGPTTIWKFIRDGRLDIVRVAGIKRTLIVYDSLVRLLAPTSGAESSVCVNRGRPRKPLRYFDPDRAGSSQ